MKRYRYGLFFLTVILGAFALYRCFADRRPDRKEPESVRIGITLYRDDDTFINSICLINDHRSSRPVYHIDTDHITAQNSQVDRLWLPIM